jgi:hypothetical protein
MAGISGGEKAQAYLANLAKAVGQGATLRVGWLENAKYPDGTPVAMVAAIQNFGAPSRGIPPRPTISKLVADKSDEWGPALAEILKANEWNGAYSLSILGEGMVGQLRQEIVDVSEPALSPVTLMLRKMFGNNPQDIRGRDVGEAARRVAAGEDYGGVSTKPLVWTGHMLASIDKEVNDLQTP